MTDANSATLNSSSTSFTDILLSNSDISDISAYLSNEISEDSSLYDPITTNLVNLINTYVEYVRGLMGLEILLNLMVQIWPKTLQL